jgi:membrane associated rhomboid family serine protease
LCGLLGATSAMLLLDLPGQQLIPALRWQAQPGVQAHPWTLWTSSLVHLSLAHGAANLLALGAVALLGHGLRAGRAQCLALLLAWPLHCLALARWPGGVNYSGLSGLLHAAVAVLASFIAINFIVNKVSAADKAMGLLLSSGLLLKLAHERGWSQAVVFSPEWGFNVVQAAHLSGALVGATCGLLCALLNLAYQRRA